MLCWVDRHSLRLVYFRLLRSILHSLSVLRSWNVQPGLERQRDLFVRGGLERHSVRFLCVRLFWVAMHVMFHLPTWYMRPRTVRLLLAVHNRLDGC